MAAEGGSHVGEGWRSWQIALAVGTPVALGAAGVWLYKRKTSSRRKNDKDKEPPPVIGAPEASVEQNPIQKAQSAKNRGNKYFKAGRYDKAIECYTEAIEVCPGTEREDLSTFHQNRAAAYEQLKNYSSVINDCTKALEYNSHYIKALHRRAKAAEVLNDLTRCLEDITAVCILENFSNQQSLILADRVLKDLGRSSAKAKYCNRQAEDPSPQFVRNYFSGFANDPLLSSLNGVEKLESGTLEVESYEKEKLEEMEKDFVQTSPFKKALRQIKNKQYSEIVKLCSDEINLTSSAHIAEALLLRATFYLLRGETNCAVEDFEQLLCMDGVDKRIRSNALIKRGTLKMQQSQKDEALEDFNLAAIQDPENSDIYHHRGQYHILLERLEDAVKDFEKSVTLSPSFAIAHVQKCYTDFRLAVVTESMMSVEAALMSFEKTIDRFPKCTEGYALYGQALTDLKQFEKADENFKRALELEPDNGNIYVHRGLLRLQWKQDIDEAARLITKAMQVDEKCELAYETLGTIEIQRGRMEKAIELFNRAIELAKTEAEMAHLFSLLDAALAQSRVAKYLGIQLPSMI